MAELGFDAVLNVGIEGVDDQHRAIARMLDTLAACGNGKESAETVSDVMTAIGQLIRAHFESEEAVLVQLGAPAEEVRAHRNDHTRLVDQYVGLLVNELNGKPPNPSDVAAFLHGWFHDHFENHDCKLRQYVVQRNGQPA